MTAPKVALGRYLFYDTRLSLDGSMSCATCHRQDLAFTDGLARAEGVTGDVHPRSSMSLANVVYSSRLTWANPLIEELERQALIPMFGETPIEMGLAGSEAPMLSRLKADDRYLSMFAAAFPREAEPITIGNITRAIASFERALISGDSPYDRYVQGDETALSPSAQRGMALFNSERLECARCHGGITFTEASRPGSPAADATAYHQTGLYNLDGRGAYPENNRGLMDVTGNVRDMGRFRAPTLRNVAVTAPYMHDGSIATLDDVLDHYARGGRARSNRTSEFLPGFTLSDEERRDVVAFLESLTDHTFLTDRRFSDPFTESP